MPRHRGFYARRIFPWLNDRLTHDAQLEALREETLQPARGMVVEIGFGTGANLRHYPIAVTRVIGIEPNDGMIRRARGGASIVQAEGERIPLRDASCDTAVMTLVLCSVDDPALTLSEVRRVLRPDGRLIVIEHGLAADARIARWQHRLNRLENLVGDGCNLNRPIAELIAQNAFRFASLNQMYAPHIPKTHGYITVAVAVPVLV